jgi:protein gp37
MATKIEWTREPGRPPGQTWNPWWGCREVGPECGKFAPNGEDGVCYAADFAGRGIPRDPNGDPFHPGVAKGGKWTGVISYSPPSVWCAPFKWPTRTMVFTCSMSDFWYEDVPLDWLAQALDVIDQTQHLTYLVLSKRPGNIARRLAELRRELPANVWLGLTVGHVLSLRLIKPFRRLEPTKKFLSCEPLLTPLVPGLDLADIDWVIGGGQSGKQTATCDPNWMRDLRDHCIANHTPFFLKQWGTWASNPTPRDQELDLKAKGGATLDGRLWREFPA